MTKNMTTLDRRLRALLAVPVALGAGIVVGPASVGSIVLYAIAAVMLATSAVGYCPLYSVARLGGPQQTHGRQVKLGSERNDL